MKIAINFIISIEIKLKNRLENLYKKMNKKN